MYKVKCCKMLEMLQITTQAIFEVLIDTFHKIYFKINNNIELIKN